MSGDFIPGLTHYAVDLGRPGGDYTGVCLVSTAHPLSGNSATLMVLDEYFIDPNSLETIEIDIPVDAAPELSYAYSRLEFNDHFGPAARVTLARERAEARALRKAHNRARYRRRLRA